MKEIELFKYIKEHIGMFVPNSTYDNYVSLLIGYNMAKNDILLRGFSAWLSSKYGLPANFAFSQQIKYYLFKERFNKVIDKKNEFLLIDCLYEKLVEFWREKDNVSATSLT